MSVAILMGSDSDLDVVSKAFDVLDSFDVKYTKNVLSAHRTPAEVLNLVNNAESSGIKVFIAAAGMAAHLAGVVAAHTTLPVIGIPIPSGSLNGMDSLLSTVQMPPGIPVATVAIGNSKNAGLLAARMLGAMDEDLANRIQKYQEESAVEVKAKASKLEEVGPFEYTWP